MGAIEVCPQYKSKNLTIKLLKLNGFIDSLSNCQLGNKSIFAILLGFSSSELALWGQSPIVPSLIGFHRKIFTFTESRML